MSTSHTIQASASVSSGKMLRAMVGIGLICALMIVLTYEGTLPLIEKNKAEALEKAVFRVLPGTITKKNFKLEADNKFIEVSEEVKEGPLVYAGYDDNGKLVGIALEASGMGFADVLRILYGYDPTTEQVIGFYVLESKETPGLGDKIEKDEAFLANFEELDVSLEENKESLKNTVVPVKNGQKQHAWEVDGITGATISSRAIGNILGTSTAEWMPIIYQNLKVFETTINEAETVQQ